MQTAEIVEIKASVFKSWTGRALFLQKGKFLGRGCVCRDAVTACDYTACIAATAAAVVSASGSAANFVKHLIDREGLSSTSEQA